MNEIFEDVDGRSELLRPEATVEEREDLELSEFAVAVVVGCALFGLGMVLGAIAVRIF